MREIKELLNTPFETTDETKEPYIFSYATSDEGILLYNPADKSFNTLIKKDNLPNGAIIAGCGIYVDGRNRIYVGDTHGVTCQNGDKEVYDVKKNMLYFSSLLINNQLVTPQSEERILSESFPFTQKT